MKKLTEHLRDEMFIAQIIYEFNVNLSRRSCSRYFVKDEVWLNARNLSIARFAVKLDDHNVNLFKIKRVFENNSLVIELNLSTFMKIHSVFHVILLSHITSDSLSSQRQKSQELVVIKNDERFWYVNSILNFKRDKHYHSFLLKYYVDWEDHFSTWKSFHLRIIVSKRSMNIISSTLSLKNHMYCHVWCFNVNIKNFKFNLHHLDSAQIWLKSCLDLTQTSCLKSDSDVTQMYSSLICASSH